MATRLYETLGVKKDASPEEIKKAYKKKALETHPDRLPAGSTPADKKVSEERFQKVSTAYEVLLDQTKRRAYDIHGVWPPPDPRTTFTDDQRAPRFRSRPHRPPNAQFAPDPFSAPFFSSSHGAFDFGAAPPGGRRRTRSHRDDLFHVDLTNIDEMLNDFFALHHNTMGSFSGPGAGGRPGQGRSSRNGAWGEWPHALERERSGFGSRDRFSSFSRDPLADFFANAALREAVDMRPSPTNGRGASGFISEEFRSSTVNGVTHTTRTKRDANGNVHVYNGYPDGRETYTVNGVEQPAPGAARHSRLPSTSRRNADRQVAPVNAPQVDMHYDYDDDDMELGKSDQASADKEPTKEVSGIDSPTTSERRRRKWWPWRG